MMEFAVPDCVDVGFLHQPGRGLGGMCAGNGPVFADQIAGRRGLAGGAGDGRDAVVRVEPFPLRLQRVPFHAADPIEAKTVHMVFFQPEAHHILHVGQGVG